MSEKKKEQLSLKDIIKDSAKRALGGGAAGAAAMTINVLSLMWIRTGINYQYRHGTDLTTAFKTIYKQGGILRFYSGLGPALLQVFLKFKGPLARFGDTAANQGTLHLLNEFEQTKNLPIGFKTLFASAAAGIFRIVLMPIDTLKTIMQVEGKQGIPILLNKLKKGPQVLYYGSIATAGATFVGHYPWFFTYNYLQKAIPEQDTLSKNLLRNAFIGFCSSFTSDCISNSLRVVKVYRQTHSEKVSYPEAARQIISSEGVLGLMGRGLKTKIIANGLQGIMFSVLWKYIDDYIKLKMQKKQ